MQIHENEIKGKDLTGRQRKNTLKIMVLRTTDGFQQQKWKPHVKWFASVLSICFLLHNKRPQISQLKKTQMYHLTVLWPIVQVDYASFSALSSIRLKSSCQQAGLLLGGQGCWLYKLVPGTCKQSSCFPCWLLAGGCSQILEALSGPCVCLPLSQSQQQFQILLMLSISVFFDTFLFLLLLHISDF